MGIYSVTKKMPLVLMVFVFDTVFTENYTITRRSKDIRTGQIQPDLVQIPPSLCHNNGTTECPLMDAERESTKTCQCACKQKDASQRLYKTTFQFHNETWKCTKNAELHKLSGCLFSLDGTGEATFPTLLSDVTFRHSLSNFTTEEYIQLPEGTTCAVKGQNSTYLKCNGEWEQLNSTIMAKRFRISYGQPFDGKYLVRVWVNATERVAYPLPSGRIIRLAITCSDRPWEPSQCIVAKIEGQIQCPAPLPSVSSTTPPRPSTSATSVLTSATPSPSTTNPPTVSSSTSSVSSQMPSSTTEPTVKGGVESRNIFSGTLIGVVLGGIAVLLALVIIIVIITKRRRKRSDDNRKNSRAAMVVNESFEQGDDLEDGSNHPYANINPSVLPSNASALNNNGKGGHRNSVLNKVYEVVEELDKPKSANNNEVQEGLTNTNRKEPLPAIPESNMFITYKVPHNYENVDNNNTGPHYASLYEVVDGPQSNDSLREHGASLNMPSGSGYGPKGAQGGSHYDTVESVIED